MKKTIFFIIILILFLSSVLTVAEAGQATGLEAVLERIKVVLGGAAITIIAIMGIWTAILYATSIGDPEKMSQARRSLVYLVIAAVVLVLSYSIYSLVEEIIFGS